MLPLFARFAEKYPGVITILLKVLAVVAVVLFIYYKGYSAGSSSVTEEWNAEKLAQQEANQKLAEEYRKKAELLDAEYAKKASELQEGAVTIIKKVPYYVPNNSCPLPAGFRVLHDCSARGDSTPSCLNDAAGETAATPPTR